VHPIFKVGRVPDHDQRGRRVEQHDVPVRATLA
jgi:hypothetical protein